MPFLFSIVLEDLARAIRQENEEKYIQTTKEEVKLPLFADNMALLIYKENPKDFIKKTVRLINEFSKGTGYKAFRKQLHFSNSKISEKEIKKTVSFILALKQ